MDGLTETYLEQRFSRPLAEAKAVTYELTKDVGYLHQYYLLRDSLSVYNRDDQHIRAQQDAFDAHSEVVVARIGNQVIGGARMTFSDDTPGFLPMDRVDFKLSRASDEFKNKRCVELSRIAIMPEFEHSTVMLELLRAVMLRATQRRAAYCVMMCPLIQTRNIHRASRLFGYQFKIMDQLMDAPRVDEDDQTLVLSVLDLMDAYHDLGENPASKSVVKKSLELVH